MLQYSGLGMGRVKGKSANETTADVGLRLGRFFVFGAIHLVTATVGVSMITALTWFGTQEVLQLFLPAFTHHRASYFLLELPGYPLQCLEGLYIGYVVATRFGHAGMRLVWIPALLFHCIVWASYLTSFSSFFEHYSFGPASQSACGVEDGCLVKATTTLFLVCSVAYALGASVELRRKRNH